MADVKSSSIIFPVPLMVRVPSAVSVHDWSPESFPESMTCACSAAQQLNTAAIMVISLVFMVI